VGDERSPSSTAGTALEVFGAFLRLGLTSFGGPVAHLGYFRDAFVARRRWLDEAAFADLVALCQFLPGPASSQVGFSIGLGQAGLAGGFAAWLGFTAPSALALFAFAELAGSLHGAVFDAALHGLKIVAVAVVAQAVVGMARPLGSAPRRVAIALGAALFVAMAPGALAQIGAIALGALAAAVFCRETPQPPVGRLSVAISRRLGIAALAAFAVILVGVQAAASALREPGLILFNAFYRSGALVFGGGHVVLPLLKAAVVDPGLVSPSAFLAGYGAAQAAPGPLFAVSAYLGAAAVAPPNGATGAVIAVAGIFLPGILILIGALPFWDDFRARAGARAAMAGINAAVVGILAAALYDPVWKGAVHGSSDVALAAAAFAVLVFWKLPPWIVVVGAVAGAVGLRLIG
jgi:chromate transporter